MTRTPTRLAGPANVSNAAATKYTAPAGGALIRHIHVANPSVSDATFTLSIGADAAGTRILDAVNVPAGTQLEHHCYYPLANGEIVQALGGTNNALKLTIGGDEFS